jgi:hypothetical protein
MLLVGAPCVQRFPRFGVLRFCGHERCGLGTLNPTTLKTCIPKLTGLAAQGRVCKGCACACAGCLVAPAQALLAMGPMVHRVVPM